MHPYHSHLHHRRKGWALGLFSLNKGRLKGGGDLLAQLPIGRANGRLSQTFLTDAQQNGKDPFHLHVSGNLFHMIAAKPWKRIQGGCRSWPSEQASTGNFWRSFPTQLTLWSIMAKNMGLNFQCWYLVPKTELAGPTADNSQAHELNSFWQEWLLYAAPAQPHGKQLLNYTLSSPAR